MRLHCTAATLVSLALGCTAAAPSSVIPATDAAATDTGAASDSGNAGTPDSANTAPDAAGNQVASDAANPAPETAGAEVAADTATASVDVPPPMDVSDEPCGNVAGKTMCDTWLQGRIRNEKTGLATAADFAPFNMVEAMATANQKYAVVMLGAWWCGKCRAATSLVVSKLPQYHEKACFVNLLVEGQTPSVPAKKSDVDSWIGLMKVPFTVGGDDPSTAFLLKNSYGQRETTYVVERATMKILAKKANAALALQELDKLP